MQNTPELATFHQHITKFCSILETGHRLGRALETELSAKQYQDKSYYLKKSFCDLFLGLVGDAGATLKLSEST